MIDRGHSQPAEIQIEAVRPPAAQRTPPCSARPPPPARRSRRRVHAARGTPRLHPRAAATDRVVRRERSGSATRARAGSRRSGCNRCKRRFPPDHTPWVRSAEATATRRDQRRDVSRTAMASALPGYPGECCSWSAHHRHAHIRRSQGQQTSCGRHARCAGKQTRVRASPAQAGGREPPRARHLRSSCVSGTRLVGDVSAAPSGSRRVRRGSLDDRKGRSASEASGPARTAAILDQCRREAACWTDASSSSVPSVSALTTDTLARNAKAEARVGDGRPAAPAEASGGSRRLESGWWIRLGRRRRRARIAA